MPRAKGTPKTGGRKKGTPNKKSLELNEIFHNLDFSIPDKLVSLLPSLSPEKQADVCLKLMEFQYPKKKAVEVKNEDSGLQLNHSLLMEVIAARRSAN